MNAKGSVRGSALLACAPLWSALMGYAAGSGHVQLAAADRAAIDRVGADALAAQHVAGPSITLARNGSIVYAHGFGARERDGTHAVDAVTIFPIGSLTKQFTAAAVELLALDGKLSIDAPLAAYVPHAPHAREVTLRELLQQTSGLANYTAQPTFSAVAASTTVTPHDLLALVANEPLGFVPGTRFEYSNTNYVALGAVIEAVAKKPYADVIRDRIARPLALRTLTFGPPSDAPNVVRTPWTPQATYAAGALYVSPADLVRWNEAFSAPNCCRKPSSRR